MAEKYYHYYFGDGTLCVQWALWSMEMDQDKGQVWPDYTTMSNTV